ncbi:MAG: hypothetical protein J6P16_03860 [Eubacterium sp.]|nr:hypothetical protein [Eubacterium sp.]
MNLVSKPMLDYLLTLGLICEIITTVFFYMHTFADGNMSAKLPGGQPADWLETIVTREDGIC